MPFTYPNSRITRRHAPEGYENYQAFKPWLRDEFTFRCVFCLVRERMCGPSGKDGFAVEHLFPRVTRPDLELDYANLVYACAKCNSIKGSNGPVLDPCRVAYASHLRVNADGTISGRTAGGRNLIRLLRLDREELVTFRREAIALIGLARRSPQETWAQRVIAQYLSYPGDMPDLRTLRPPRNTRPASVNDCCYARWERMELDETY